LASSRLSKSDLEGKVGKMQTVLTNKAELPFEGWLGFFDWRIGGFVKIALNYLK
jgi:hypothetical protein